MVCIFAAAQESVKRACFNTFWFSHHFFILFWGMLLIHGPRFWIWSAVPLVVYFVGRVQRARWTVDKVILEEVVIEPPNVVKLVLRNGHDVAGKYDLFRFDYPLPHMHYPRTRWP